MSYLDTCVIIAYGFEEEENHDSAEKIIQKGINYGCFCVSTFSIVELFCVLSRKTKNYRLPPWIEKLADEETKIELTVRYLLKKLNAKILPDNSSLANWSDIDFFHIFLDAMRCAIQMKLKGTGDTVHIAYVKKFRDEEKIQYFITIDPDMNAKKTAIEQTAKIKLL